MAQKLGYKINFSDVFLNRTPRELAALQKTDSLEVKDEEITTYDYSRFAPSITMWKYVERFINMLQRLGFFVVQ